MWRQCFLSTGEVEGRAVLTGRGSVWLVGVLTKNRTMFKQRLGPSSARHLGIWSIPLGQIIAIPGDSARGEIQQKIHIWK